MPAKKFQPLPSEYFAKPVIPYLSGPPVDGSKDGDSSGRAAAEDRMAALSYASMVILQVEELMDLPDCLSPFRRPPLEHVKVLMHLDLIRGLARDEAGLRFLAGLERIDAIITVHHHLVSAAKRFGLQSIVRLFIQDGRSVKRGLAVVEKSRPNGIELLPGIAAAEVANDFARLPIPRFAGGLIRNTTILQAILDTGYKAVSTSNESLWLENARR
ncbi:MAG: glycerol-3-phosphate responsive antiterminator [Planctomycetota bacterium]|nr:glycerol-3-phosphate responsive antiterminator [Planctomycetota bacterium]